MPEISTGCLLSAMFVDVIRASIHDRDTRLQIVCHQLCLITYTSLGPSSHLPVQVHSRWVTAPISPVCYDLSLEDLNDRHQRQCGKQGSLWLLRNLTGIVTEFVMQLDYGLGRIQQAEVVKIGHMSD